MVNRPITTFASCVPLAWLCRIVTKFRRRTQARKRACVAAQGALACLASLRVCVKSEYKSHLILAHVQNKSNWELIENEKRRTSLEILYIYIYIYIYIYNVGRIVHFFAH